MRERHPVHRARHVDVGENQSDFTVEFEATNGLGGVRRLVNDKAFRFQGGRRVHPNQVFVLDDEDRNALILKIAHPA